MDSIFNTTTTAFEKFFNVSRRMGHISVEERSKLLLLWFFYYLKYDSKFLWEYDIDNVHGTGAGWYINRELEDQVNNTFHKAMECLRKNTCTIRYIQGDCTQIAEIVPISTPENVTVEQILISNDADPTGLQDVDSDNIQNVSFNDLLQNAVWTQDSMVFQTDDSTSTNEIYLSYE